MKRERGQFGGNGSKEDQLVKWIAEWQGNTARTGPGNAHSRERGMGHIEELVVPTISSVSPPLDKSVGRYSQSS
jgi:hypothetical protein